LGIWLIKYGLQQEAQEEYLDWFHDIHIAEKLARPGYTWASHYRNTWLYSVVHHHACFMTRARCK